MTDKPKTTRPITLPTTANRSETTKAKQIPDPCDYATYGAWFRALELYEEVTLEDQFNEQRKKQRHETY